MYMDTSYNPVDEFIAIKSKEEALKDRYRRRECQREGRSYQTGVNFRPSIFEKIKALGMTYGMSTNEIIEFAIIYFLENRSGDETHKKHG